MIKELSGGRVRLVKGRHDALAGQQNLVSCEPAGHGSVKEGPSHGILKATADANSLQLPHVQNCLCAGGSGSVKVNGQENARDADLVILKTIVPGVNISI